MDDVYADVEYDFSELPALKHEAEAILHEVVEDQELESMLQQVVELVGQAISEGQGLSAIAD